MRAVPVLAIALIAFPVFAQTNDVAVWGGSSRVGNTPTIGSNVHFDRGSAYGVSFTHFFSHHYAAEIAAYELRHDGTIRVAGVDALDIGRLTMTPLTATLQWHAEHEHRFDPYAGAGLAWVHASNIHSSDLTNAGIGTVHVESRVGFTALAGASYAITHPFAVAVEARYIGYQPSSGPADARLKLQLSPLVYSVGLRWRF
ncbi:MAG TPA: OmpW family outer membrane protein [Thermoanaerobaculia bacterium]|nr:OmpW family outer membrane protein [Thermoanaerobaculia bacterium]